MITATYRTLSTRLREHVNAGETGQENAVYIGQDIDGSCDSGLVHNGLPIAIDLATGKKPTEESPWPTNDSTKRKPTPMHLR